MTESTTQMIAQIEELKSKLYDRESELLGQQHTHSDDPWGNKTREIAELRRHVELLDRTINMLKIQEQK